MPEDPYAKYEDPYAKYEQDPWSQGDAFGDKQIDETSTTPKRKLSKLEQLKAWAEQKSEDNRPKSFQDVLTKVGNTRIMPLGNVVQSAGGNLGPLPDPTVAGLVRGVADIPAGIGRFAANVAGAFGADQLASDVNAGHESMGRYWDENYNKDETGRMVGGALPFLLTGGASATGQIPGWKDAAKEIAKTAAEGAGWGAVSQKQGIKEGEYWGRAGEDALKAGVLSGGMKYAARPGSIPNQALDYIKRKAGKFGGTKAPQEFLDELTKDYPLGAGHGDVAKEAALTKYASTTSEGSSKYAPIQKAGETVELSTPRYSDKINELIDRMETGRLAVNNPETLPYLKKLQKEVGKANGLQKGGSVDEVANFLAELKSGNKQTPVTFNRGMEMDTELSKAQRSLAPEKTQAADNSALAELRDALSNDMEDASPDLHTDWLGAKGWWKENVIPLREKSAGGKSLADLRNSPEQLSNDYFSKYSQGKLARMRPEEAGVVARGSAAEPMLAQHLETAINAAKTPNSEFSSPDKFIDSMKKAMPSIEAAGTPEQIAAIKGMMKIAQSASFGGKVVLPAAAGVAVGATGGLAAGIGTSAAAMAPGFISPAMTAPGVLWKLMQSPKTRGMMVLASKMKAGSPELRTITAKIAAIAQASKSKPSPKPAKVEPIPEEYNQEQEEEQ